MHQLKNYQAPSLLAQPLMAEGINIASAHAEIPTEIPSEDAELEEGVPNPFPSGGFPREIPVEEM